MPCNSPLMKIRSRVMYDKKVEADVSWTVKRAASTQQRNLTMQSLTGQYECSHRSALGLDYFTARLDRLTLYANGRFSLITQDKSRLIHAAKNLAAGQQGGIEAPETPDEGI